MTDGPSVEQDISQYYEARYPGLVRVLGPDLWNGTSSQLTTFQQVTGVTFPLLLQGGSSAGGDLATLYGPYDNYVVINPRGIVRYHAALTWPHGNRYHLAEIRGSIDSLVPTVAGVDPPGASSVRFAANPNPSAGATEFEWALPGATGPAWIEVFDLTGRRVWRIQTGGASAGEAHVRWDGGDESGAPVRAGVYLVRASIGERSITRRIVRLR
ncbi:MAG: T9SS type A sorting domain-containing protein [Candidatus Eisenbacteria bacterium]|nr:T9SS type A sorting domain-containing protein [Candidatus Eisenbacteria bacterium]